MGSFDGRCAVTGLAITNHEPVYAFVYNLKHPGSKHLWTGRNSTYELWQMLCEHRQSLVYIEEAKRATPQVGSYEDYALALKREHYLPHLMLDGTVSTPLMRYVRWEGYALYDTYGFIESARHAYDHNGLVPEGLGYNESIDYIRDNLSCWLVRKSAAEAIQAEFGTAGEPIYVAIINFAMRVRIQLYGVACDNLMGGQHLDRGELANQKFRLKLIRQGLAEQQAYLKEQYR